MIILVVHRLDPYDGCAAWWNVSCGWENGSWLCDAKTEPFKKTGSMNMTMPHLENCPHRKDGWCMECVKLLGEENQDLRMAVLEASRITFEHTHDGGDLNADPDLIVVKKCDHEQYRKASALIGDVCKKWLI